MKPTTAHAAPADVLEMLFSDRNKAYGAYQLRREYPEAMRKATLLMLLATGLLALWAFRKSTAKPRDTKTEVVVDWKKDAKIEEKKAPAPVAQPKVEPPKAAPQIKFLPPKLTANTATEPSEEPPTLRPEDIPEGTRIGASNIGGEPSEPPVLNSGNTGSRTGIIENPPTSTPEDEPLTFVSAMPTFPGGELELLRYLQKHIRYPELAVEAGVRGRVVLQFVVEKDGRISDAKIVRDIGSGCGREALRVLTSMPPWKPGNQNGQPVRVRMTLPVVFEFK